MYIIVLLKQSQDAKPYVRSSLMKTWLNAWTTTRRMNEAKRETCLFGCTQAHHYSHDVVIEAKDDLEHYLCCDRLWFILDVLGPLPTGATGRLAMLPLTLASAVRLAAAFYIYHAVKFSKDMGSGIRQSSNWQALLRPYAKRAYVAVS